MVMQCVRASLLFVGCISILAGSAVALCPAGQFYNVSSASSVVPSGMRLRWTKNAPAEEIKTGKYAVRWVIELNPEGVAINKAGSAEGNLFLEAEAGSPRSLGEVRQELLEERRVGEDQERPDTRLGREDAPEDRLGDRLLAHGVGHGNQHAHAVIIGLLRLVRHMPAQAPVRAQREVQRCSH